MTSPPKRHILRYALKFFGAIIGALIFSLMAALFFLATEFDCSDSGFLVRKCTDAEASLKWLHPLVFVVIVVYGIRFGWIHIARFLCGAVQSFRKLALHIHRLKALADWAVRAVNSGYRTIRSKRPSFVATTSRIHQYLAPASAPISKRGQKVRALTVAVLIGILLTLQITFLSVVVDAVDKPYIQSDRYHITANYLITISELLFAGALAIQFSNIRSCLAHIRASQKAFFMTMLTSFLVFASVIGPVRDAIINDFLASRSTEDRRFAALIAINQMALVLDRMDFKEADLGAEEIVTPEAKIMLFLSPAILYLAAANSLEQSYPEKVDTLLRAVDEDGIVKRLQNAAERETREYCGYFEELYRHYTGSVNGAVEIISKAAANGLGSQRTYHEASDYYFNTINDKLGRGWAVLPGLTRAEFIEHRDVQKAIKQRIRDNLPAVRTRLADSEFRGAAESVVAALERITRKDAIYIDPCRMNEKVVRGISADVRSELRQEIDRALNPEDSSLKVGGVHEKYGSTALRIAIMPMLSITLLLVGMVFNGRGVIVLVTSRILGAPRILSVGLTIVFLCVAVTWPFTRPHPYLDNGAIAEMLELIGRDHGALERYGLEWITRSATAIYFVGTDIRSTLGLRMMGLDQHIDDKLETGELGSGLGADALM